VVVWIAFGIILWWLGAVATYSVISRPSEEVGAAMASMAWFLIVPIAAIVSSV